MKFYPNLYATLSPNRKLIFYKNLQNIQFTETLTSIKVKSNAFLKNNSAHTLCILDLMKFLRPNSYTQSYNLA